MKTESRVPEAKGASDAKENTRERLARHLEQQSQSTRTFDKVMKVLELAGLALVAGWLAWAIYGSINWSVQRDIVAAWFAFPVSMVLLVVFVGIHAIGLRAFPPLLQLSSMGELVTGSKAVATGMGLALLILIVGAFWGAFAYGIWAENWAILKPLTQVVGVVVGVGAVIALFSDLRRRFFRSR